MTGSQGSKLPAGAADVPSEPKEIVRRGYDAVSERYRADDDEPPRYTAWLAALRARMPSVASVLDLGCGCGVPISRTLADLGHDVVGVDISAVQVERARRLVPDARFIQADAASVSFPLGSFDAIVCLYMLIHLPHGEQEALIRESRHMAEARRRPSRDRRRRSVDRRGRGLARRRRADVVEPPRGRDLPPLADVGRTDHRA
jgi:SAM-dependent methyltransferase